MMRMNGVDAYPEILDGSPPAPRWAGVRPEARSVSKWSFQNKIKTIFF